MNEKENANENDRAVPAIVIRDPSGSCIKFRITDDNIRDDIAGHLSRCNVGNAELDELTKWLCGADSAEYPFNYGCLRLELANESELAECEESIRRYPDTVGMQFKGLTDRIREIPAKLRLKLDLGCLSPKECRIEYGILVNCDLSQGDAYVFDDCNRYEYIAYGTERKARDVFGNIPMTTAYHTEGRLSGRKTPLSFWNDGCSLTNNPLGRAMLDYVPQLKASIIATIGGDESSVEALTIHYSHTKEKLEKPFYVLHVLSRKIIEIGQDK